MIKNITIVSLTVALLIGTLYHTTTVNTLQDKYDKTCESSVKKSNRVSELTKELKKTYDYQIWLHEHSTPVVIGEPMPPKINKTIKPKRVIITPFDEL